MNEATATRPKCVQCRKPIDHLVAVELYDGSRGWMHDCGVAFTPQFVADHYGIDLGESA